MVKWEASNFIFSVQIRVFLINILGLYMAFLFIVKDKVKRIFSYV